MQLVVPRPLIPRLITFFSHLIHLRRIHRTTIWVIFTRVFARQTFSEWSRNPFPVTQEPITMFPYGIQVWGLIEGPESKVTVQPVKKRKPKPPHAGHA